MAENKETKTEVLKCVRCEQKDASPTTEGVKVYDPRIAGEPYRTVNLCPKCAKNEPQAVVIEEAEPPLEGKALDEAIAEIMTEDSNEIETIKFEPVTPEPIQETIVTPKSKVPKASENLAKDVETKAGIQLINRADIEKKVKTHEKDIDTLQSQRKELVEKANVLRNQIGQVSEIITQKIGAVAGLRDLLGNE